MVKDFPTDFKQCIFSPMVDSPLTSLELFLLNLVAQGLNTPYVLKSSAGLSVGATLPALSRLKKRKLLQRAEVAARNKQEFEVTPLGKKIMLSEMKRLLAQAKTTPPTDTESALRLAALAFFSKKHDAAMILLTSVGESRLRLAQVRAKDFNHVATADLPTLYRSLSGTCEGARSEAEGEALIALARELRKAKP
jgi:hypothetical protein